MSSKPKGKKGTTPNSIQINRRSTKLTKLSKINLPIPSNLKLAAAAATSKGGWVVAAQAQHGNPYDGHTLASTIEQFERLTNATPNEVFVDMGYRKHDYTGTSLIHVDRRRRGNIPRNTWRWMKHRAAIEPTLGHLKDNKRLDRNRLKGVLGDKINVILSAAGMNFHKIMKALAQGKGFLRKILGWLLGIRINRSAAMLFQLG